MAHSEEEISKHVKTYMKVFYSLLALTVLTVAVSYLEVNMTLALIIGLAIATFKSWLVAGYFMHLVEEKKMIHAILLLTFVFFLAMVFLFIFAYYGHEGGEVGA